MARVPSLHQGRDSHPGEDARLAGPGGDGDVAAVHRAARSAESSSPSGGSSARARRSGSLADGHHVLVLSDDLGDPLVHAGIVLEVEPIAKRIQKLLEVLAVVAAREKSAAKLRLYFRDVFHGDPVSGFRRDRLALLHATDGSGSLRRLPELNSVTILDDLRHPKLLSALPFRSILTTPSPTRSAAYPCGVPGKACAPPAFRKEKERRGVRRSAPVECSRRRPCSSLATGAEQDRCVPTTLIVGEV
jgi:hypothetical protein